jgi:copper chaperone
LLVVELFKFEAVPVAVPATAPPLPSEHVELFIDRDIAPPDATHVPAMVLSDLNCQPLMTPYGPEGLVKVPPHVERTVGLGFEQPKSTTKHAELTRRKALFTGSLQHSEFVKENIIHPSPADAVCQRASSLASSLATDRNLFACILCESIIAFFRHKEDQMAKETQNLNVQGMSCQHCVHAVKSSVSALGGVETVDVSLEKNLVTVGFDPSKTSLESIKSAIEDQGYSVVPS